jgi:predicted NBD/HSP70 family sugar kinase
VYCTAEAILREARIAALNRDHLIDREAPILPISIEEVATSNAPIFRDVVRSAAKRLGSVLGQAIAILDPELILLGGETLESLGNDFVEQLIEEIPNSAMPSKPLPTIKRSALGADAGAIGAAALVLHEAYAPRIQLLNLT